MSGSKSAGDDPEKDITDAQTDEQAESDASEGPATEGGDVAEDRLDEEPAEDEKTEDEDEVTAEHVELSDDEVLSDDDEPTTETSIEDAEIVADDAPDVTELPAPVPEAAPAASGGGAGFLPLLIGGLVAGGIGYGAAYFQPKESSEPMVAVDLSLLEGGLAEQAARVDQLEAALAAAEPSEGAAPFDSSALEGQQAALNDALGGLASKIDGVDASIASLRGDFEALASRVTDIENKPDEPLTADGAQAMAEQLSAFQSELDTVTATARNEIEAAQARASEIEAAAMAAERAAQSRAALAELQAALESGLPYSDALTAFDDVSDGLKAGAGDGVATVASLRESFPVAARAALAETQTVPADSGVGDRLTAFLRRQTNARSLAPRDGDDPDAVLSRAEAALTAGDLQGALSELDALPAEAAVRFEDWRAQASGRLSALDGAEALRASINEN